MALDSSSSQPLGLRQIAVFGVLLALLLTGALFPLLPEGLHLRAGQIAAQTIHAPQDLSYESRLLTEGRRAEAAAAAPEVLVYRPEVRDQQLRRLEASLGTITALRARRTMSPEERRQALTRREGPALSPLAAQVALDLEDSQWEEVAKEGRRLLTAILTTEIGPGDVPGRQDELRQQMSLAFDAGQALLLEDLVRPLVLPTLAVDEARTRERREAARAQVVPVQVTLAKGQSIVAQGDIIGADDIEALAELGLLSRRLRLDEVAGVGLMAALVALALALLLRIFPPRGVAVERRLLALVLVLTLWTLAARFYFDAVLPDLQRHYLAYLLPVAAGPMAVASLLGAPLGLLTAAALALLTTYAGFYLPAARGLAPADPLQVIQMLAVFLLTALVGVSIVHRAERAHQYLLAGAAGALVAFFTLLAFWLLGPGGSSLDILWMGISGSVGGALSAILTLAGLIFLGILLGITTRFQLLELAHLGQPLLRRLQEEAPGTFHHSIIVGNLAEAAAHAIGADALLVRVGSYYHDVGKVAQPGFYIENQLGGDNPHTGLAPEQSASIIRRHVVRGVELARRQRLPAQLLAFIQEHHGTRLVTYFYRQAAQEHPELDPAPFAYTGPRPRSRESALVMLADSVEAVVRSSAERSPQTIDSLVDAVIAERLAEGQLDECDLTLRELRSIAQSFKAALKGVYHPRIDYPAPTGAERERLRALTPFLEAPPVPVDGTALPPSSVAHS